MKIRNTLSLSLCALTFVLATPAAAATVSGVASTPAATESKSATASSTSDTSSNGSSTGVGNAGSHGIGSGTSDSISDSIATATATSNGLVDSSVDNSVHSGTTINVIADQELSAASTNNQMTFTGSDAAPALLTGSNALSGGAFANYAGVLNNGWNTAPAGNAQAATNIAINGSIGAK